MDLKKHIRSIPDFPKPGILFYDIATLLAHGAAWKETVAQLKAQIAALKPDYLVGIESRGFLIAAPVAAELGIGFVMARKKGKLPGAKIAHTYALEYGSDTIEMQEGMLPEGARVVIVDDLLATGGTAQAVVTLARKLKATVVGCSFIIELAFLNGRTKVDAPCVSLLSYNE